MTDQLEAALGRCITPTGHGLLTDPAVVKGYRQRGYTAISKALESGFCRSTISSLKGASLIAVDSVDRRGETRFLTLNGKELIELAPVLLDLYRWFGNVASHVTGQPCTPLDNLRVGLSLNFTPATGAFVRHFDRNEVTVSLYLNDVPGGELEIWPNIVSPAIDLLGRYKLGVALRLTRLVRPVSIPPREGTVVIFSRRTVHGVRPVLGTKARVSVIMAYDVPGRSFADDRDYYGIGVKRVTLHEVDA